MASGTKVSNKKKHVPGDETSAEEVFDFPFLADTETIDFIENYGRIMFIIRGLPGTGKTMLSTSFVNKYINGVVCSADHYFEKAFVPKKRDVKLLKDSHLFCQNRVESECKLGTNPIIVQNTHVKRWELGHYLELANRYGYTVIMAITMRKFEATAEILEQTNTKCLTKDYLAYRLKSFEEYVPVYLGWFLGPDDQSYLFQRAKETLANLLEVGEFCKFFEINCEDDIWGHFKLQNELFCIATYCNHAMIPGRFKFYTSDEVQDIYGKCFKLSVQGFLVTQDMMLAVVDITKDMKSLMMGSKSRKKSALRSKDDLSSLFDSLTTRDVNMNKKLSKTFTEEFKHGKKTSVLEDLSENEHMNIKHISFILIAQSSDKPNLITDISAFAKTVFNGMHNEEGAIDNSESYKLDDGSSYLCLKNDFWLVSLPQKICMSAVFTGKYV